MSKADMQELKIYTYNIDIKGKPLKFQITSYYPGFEEFFVAIDTLNYEAIDAWLCKASKEGKVKDLLDITYRSIKPDGSSHITTYFTPYASAIKAWIMLYDPTLLSLIVKYSDKSLLYNMNHLNNLPLSFVYDVEDSYKEPLGDLKQQINDIE
jgi:hypothetical protein